MTLNDAPMNREAFDAVERAILGDLREMLLRLLGPQIPCLIVWHYLSFGELRSPREIHPEKILEFFLSFA